MTNRKDDKITKAGAVELDENELDQVTGGANDGKQVELASEPRGGDIVKDPISKGPSGYSSDGTKRVK